MKYIALLRGINVGGHNAVPMQALRECFAGLGCTDIVTYINSGNVIFQTAKVAKRQLVAQCEQAIETQFGFHVVCAVITASELEAALAEAPRWWGSDAASSHNAIFMIAPTTTAEVMTAVGEPKPAYERVQAAGPIIFWSAPVTTAGRTSYHKLPGTKAYRSITVRNRNTTLKLLELCRMAATNIQ